MKQHMEKMAEAWAMHASLRSSAVKQIHGDVEEALGYVMFYLWASEEV